MSAPREAPPVRWAPLTDPDARRAYAALWERSPQRSVFASLAFADATCRTFGLTGGLALVDSSDGAVAGGVVVYEKRRGPLRVAAVPPMADYAGPVLAGPVSAAEVHHRASPLDALAAWAAGRFGQVTWRLHPSLTDLRALAWAGWQLRPAWEAHLPLTAGEDPARHFGRSARQRLGAHAASFVLSPGSPDDIARLAVSSLARKGLSAVSAASQRAMLAAMAAAGQARLYVATRVGIPEAGLALLVDGTTATYWVVGGAGGPGTTVLAAHAAREAAAEGCTVLSLGGANVPSVAEFKRSLGGTLVLHHIARRVTGLLAWRDALAGLHGRGR